MLNRKSVDCELEKLIDSAVRAVPSLLEIRVFGSYNNGNWNSESSDVDVFVEVGDEYYSYMRDTQWFHNYMCESEQRQELRQKITNAMDEKNRKRFNIHLLTPSDVALYWDRDEGRGPVGKSMKAGKLLYKSK